MDWIHLAQDRDPWRALANTVMNLRAPYNVEESLSRSATGGFSTTAHVHGVSWLVIYYAGDFLW
jgi:hypothetical protein